MTDSLPEADVPALRATLAAVLDDPVTAVDCLGDGVNLVLSVRTESERYVCRRPSALRDAPYMNDLRSEYAVLQGLERTPVPSPTPVAFVDDVEPLGGPFVVTEYVPGEVVPLGDDLPERFGTEAAHDATAEGLVAALSAVHAAPVDRFAGDLDRVSLGEMVEQSADRGVAATAETDRDGSRLRSLADRLRESVPTDPDVALVHGDFRPGNVCFAGRDRPRVAGVLDWETALIGDPLTDLGYLLLRWRDAGDPTPDVDAIAVRYPDADDETLAALRRANDRGIAPFTSVSGSPSRETIVERYEARTGRAFSDRRFYVALGALGLATVWEDLHRRRVAAGERSDFEPYADYAVELGELVLDGALDP